MKAVRGAELSLDTLRAYTGEGDITERLAVCDDLRIFRIFEALDSGVSVEKISEITKIDTYFIERIGRLADYERSLRSGLDREKYELGKKLGYTDAAIERISGCRIPEKKLPVYRRVEVCSAVRREPLVLLCRKRRRPASRVRSPAGLKNGSLCSAAVLYV